MIKRHYVNFNYYNNLDESKKTPEDLYFIKDRNQIYKGTELYIDNCILYTCELPKKPVADKVYVNSSTLECKTYDGIKWNNYNPTDYEQNDPTKPGYIKNRPCYYGNMTEEDYISLELIRDNIVNPISITELMIEGDIYEVTINNTAVEFVANSGIQTSDDGEELVYTYIGDNFLELLSNKREPKYGFTCLTAFAENENMFEIIPFEDQLWAPLFNISEDELENNITFDPTEPGQEGKRVLTASIRHIHKEVKKLNRDFLPDDIGSSSSGSTVKVLNIADGEKIQNVDFSQYKAGDTILVVQSASN